MENELTPEDREHIQNQIVEYRQQQLASASAHKVSVPITPDGQQANQALDEAIKEQSTPNKREARRVKNKIKGIWRKWRTTALDAKALEVEKIACQIEIERAKTQQQLNKIKREEQLAKAEHWLKLKKGNLEDMDANPTSKPSMFWYALRRGFHHITKLTNNVPKIIRNLFWIGAIVLVLIILKKFNVL